MNLKNARIRRAKKEAIFRLKNVPNTRESHNNISIILRDFISACGHKSVVKAWTQATAWVDCPVGK